MIDVQRPLGDTRNISTILSADRNTEAEARWRLLFAASASYDKHCGERAVACAEADLLGQALEALERTKSWLTSYPGGGAIPVYDQVCAVLAMAKEEK